MTQIPLAEHDQSSIVMLGSFNPRIFQPAWLVRHALLPPEAESESRIHLINNDISVFETDWCRLEVMNERFALQSLATPAVESLRDLAQGIFEILQYTPITMVGLNSSAHFSLGTADVWHAFGEALAPKSKIWDPILKNPGTLALTIQGERPDAYKGHVNVKIEPSARVRFGLFIETNEEYHVPDERGDASWVSDLLAKQWDPTQERLRTIRAQILSEALRFEQ